MGWDPDAPPNIGSPPDDRAVHRQKRAFSPSGSAGDVLRVVRVLCHSPQGVRAFEIGQVLGDIGFGERNAAGFAYLMDEL